MDVMVWAIGYVENCEGAACAMRVGGLEIYSVMLLMIWSRMGKGFNFDMAEHSEKRG